MCFSLYPVSIMKIKLTRIVKERAAISTDIYRKVGIISHWLIGAAGDLIAPPQWH